MNDDTLFADVEIPDAQRLGTAAVRERILTVMAKRGLHSWQGALTRGTMIGMINVTLETLTAAGLEISDRGRVADLKAALADWVRDFDEGRNNGGNPTETDYEELVERSRRLIGGGA